MWKRHKATSSYLNTCNLLQSRELGMKPPFGYTEDLARKIYTSIDACHPRESLYKYCGEEGGIFNLEFSLDGRTLAAACEEKSIVLFDAANQRSYKTIKRAHDGCVNCIKYLDYNTFATCSDDNTIKLWDARKLNQPECTLFGHTNWVKNIEYLENQRILVSSAFDGGVFAWDLESKTEHKLLYNSLFVLNGLMRTKITADGTKMVLCTTNGYMMIIHDLHVETLSKDLGFFKPILYRHMQQNDDNYTAATMYSYLFSQDRKRNRVELIDDFPNQPEAISSLQLHPMGWCALSRSINAEENEEWTCVHDIQARPHSEYEKAYKVVENIPYNEEYDEDTIPNEIWISLVSHRDFNLYNGPQSGSNTQSFQGFTFASESSMPQNTGTEKNCSKYKDRVFLNLPRLTNYIKEKNDGKGFIKEQCFSHDGRIMCSPYGRGLRLLGFNEEMQELAYCVPDSPKKLYTMTEMVNYHSDCVVSCKFSPTHYQMVSGCLGGEIVWYKPIF